MKGWRVRHVDGPRRGTLACEVLRRHDARVELRMDRPNEPVGPRTALAIADALREAGKQ